MKTQHPLARSPVLVRTWPFLIDMAVAGCALAMFFALVSTGAYWMGKPIPVVPISHSIGALPAYAFYSVVRQSCDRSDGDAKTLPDPCRLVRPVNESYERLATRTSLTRLLHRPDKPAGVVVRSSWTFLAKKTCSPARQAGWGPVCPPLR